MTVSKKLLVDAQMLINELHMSGWCKGTLELANELESEIRAKIEAMERRELYAKSKYAPTAEERQEARQEYHEKSSTRQDRR